MLPGVRGQSPWSWEILGILRTFCTRKSDACGQERPKATLGVTERFVHPIAPPSFLSGWRASSSTNCHHLTAAGRAVSLSDSGRGRGQEERAGGSGNLEPAEASVMRPALPWRRTSTIHRAAVVQSRGASGMGRTGGGGVGIGGGWQGSRIKLAGLHNTLKPPLRLAGADAFPDRRRARPAARQQVRISRGGCGGRQPPSIRAAPQAKFWKIAKKCQRKFSFFGRFCHRKTRPPDQPGPDFRKTLPPGGPPIFRFCNSGGGL